MNELENETLHGSLSQTYTLTHTDRFSDFPPLVFFSFFFLFRYLQSKVFLFNPLLFWSRIFFLPEVEL